MLDWRTRFIITNNEAKRIERAARGREALAALFTEAAEPDATLDPCAKIEDVWAAFVAVWRACECNQPRKGPNK